MAKKTLTLDYSKWVAGERDNQVGSGSNNFHNDQGNMCVLGQFSLQMDRKLQPHCIRNLTDPADLPRVIKGLSKKQGDDIVATKLAENAMNINDDATTTTQYKIKHLTSLFKRIGYTMKVINQPKEVTA